MSIKVGMWVVRRPECRNDTWWKNYCSLVNKRVDEKFFVTYVTSKDVQFKGSGRTASLDKFVPAFSEEMRLEYWL